MIRRTSFLLSFGGAFACGDDDGGGSSSGVGKSKLVSDVTRAEAKRVCEWVEKEAHSFVPSKRQACTGTALDLSNLFSDRPGTPATCSAKVDECLTETYEQPTPDACDDEYTSDFSRCATVTVGDVEACVKANVSAYREKTASLSCDDAGKGISTTFDTPDACALIWDECPSVLSWIDSDGGSTLGPIPIAP